MTFLRQKRTKLSFGLAEAQMAELVDAQVSGTCGSDAVEVRVFFWAPAASRRWRFWVFPVGRKDVAAMAETKITLHKGDIPAGMVFGPAVAVDTESLGLNIKRDRLCVVQFSTGDGTAHLVQFAPGRIEAPNLKKMLADPSILKIFHFARADLAMIAYYLGVMPGPVYCTKIASVLTRTFSDHHSLKDLTRELLGVELSKEQQTSDWGAETLTDKQLAYAASDVLHLHALREKLDALLARENRAELARAAFAFLPARAALDIAGWQDIDIFAHKPTR